MSRRFMVCPECEKRGVNLRLSGSEDHYACRYCDFSCFTWSPSLDMEIDKKRRAALLSLNPDLMHRDPS